jgi:hypothetical protein
VQQQKLPSKRLLLLRQYLVYVQGFDWCAFFYLYKNVFKTRANLPWLLFI